MSYRKRLTNKPYFIHHLTVDCAIINTKLSRNTFHTHTVHRLTGEFNFYYAHKKPIHKQLLFSKRMMDVWFLKVRYSSVPNKIVLQRTENEMTIDGMMNQTFSQQKIGTWRKDNFHHVFHFQIIDFGEYIVWWIGAKFLKLEKIVIAQNVKRFVIGFAFA